jgi:hypothetical protein
MSDGGNDEEREDEEEEDVKPVVQRGRKRKGESSCPSCGRAVTRKEVVAMPSSFIRWRGAAEPGCRGPREQDV